MKDYIILGTGYKVKPEFNDLTLARRYIANTDKVIQYSEKKLAELNEHIEVNVHNLVEVSASLHHPVRSKSE